MLRAEENGTEGVRPDFGQLFMESPFQDAFPAGNRVLPKQQSKTHYGDLSMGGASRVPQPAAAVGFAIGKRILTRLNSESSDNLHTLGDAPFQSSVAGPNRNRFDLDGLENLHMSWDSGTE